MSKAKKMKRRIRTLEVEVERLRTVLIMGAALTATLKDPIEDLR